MVSSAVRRVACSLVLFAVGPLAAQGVPAPPAPPAPPLTVHALLGPRDFASHLVAAACAPLGRIVLLVRDDCRLRAALRLGDEQPLHSGGGPAVIHGTADSVSEAELALRDCVRWIPDGSRIPLWRPARVPLRPFYLEGLD